MRFICILQFLITFQKAVEKKVPCMVLAPSAGHSYVLQVLPREQNEDTTIEIDLVFFPQNLLHFLKFLFKI